MQPIPAGGGRYLAPLAQQPAVKTVHVYRNGDPFYRGRRMVIHEKRVGNFDVFLKDVTGGVQAPFGAVRNIYTPRHGHRVTNLDEIQPGECYVAAGRESFKKLDYLHIGEIKKKTLEPLNLGDFLAEVTCTLYENNKVKPVAHSKINVSARFRKNLQEPCTVFLIANGDLMSPVVRLLVPRRILDQWELVLAMITDKVKLRNGAVHRLYTLEGTPIRDGSELENGQFYVAVGREKFKKLPYSDVIFSKSSMKWAHGSKASSLPPIHGYRKSNENKQERHIKSTGGSTDAVDNIISPHPPKAKKKPETQPGTEPVPVVLMNNNIMINNFISNESATFLHKTRSDLSRTSSIALEDRSDYVMQPVVTISFRLSRAPQVTTRVKLSPVKKDGIFKAGEDRSEMWGASEVQEDENTKVEVPVDQREAETVEEEVMENGDLDEGDADSEGEEEEKSEHHNILQDSTQEAEEYEENNMAEYSLPRPTSSRLLEKISTPSDAEKIDAFAVA
ncbi:doublecortin domain-containing protein 2 isoform X2 [Mixophyes fleayi]|uniref:doublecortin domain-containing protein 2 isoform X2 n=1 Tax=Mixophyes fleayi TaxID=3061075 RepID=UPI003F4E335D